ncbi:YmfQ family protein [Desulfosporosinus nitroreducens]|uniref:YmfQ family protein n=1 Tax=Desulfosporosinus nitroreducens TaxID=2018668 RepID=UPI00207D237D|nr:YmfQ family protein [Desulfosporosinus nitroreducens]MCO1603656.1 YmfQ family protein [Desulfosporosinus nitroreducens]
MSEYSIPDLMKYLPEYYQGIREMKRLQETASDEMGLFLFAIDDVLSQCFVDSATWGLDYWESQLGLTTEVNKPIDRRRESIKAKIRGSGTTTKQMIIDTASAFSGGEVDVIEYPAEYRFEVRFTGVKGIPPNMPGFIQMLEQIKPTHLGYSFKYSYTWWDSLKSLTWNSVNLMTWNELRVYE